MTTSKAPGSATNESSRLVNELAVDVEARLGVGLDLDALAGGGDHAGLALDLAGAQPVAVADQADARPGLDHDQVELAVGRVGVDLGAAAERAGERDDHLPGAAVEDALAVDGRRVAGTG